MQKKKKKKFILEKEFVADQEKYEALSYSWIKGINHEI